MKPIFIGKIKIDIPLFLAPMAGVTDPPFRELIKDFGGVGLMFSEMIPSKSLFLGNKKKSINKVNNNFDIKAVQICGNDPYYMAEASKLNVDLGADLIDINFGCPVKKVTKGFAGSAVMKDEKLAKEIMETVVKSVDVPVTVKMRMGWDFSNLNAPIIAKIAEDVGIKLVTVHCRTRSQMYEGVADWLFAKKVKNSVKTIPVIVNGDIKNVMDVKNSLEISGCDGCMIGRGIYGQPWLFAKINKELKNEDFLELNKNELLVVIFKHLELVKNYDENLNLFKKHLCWYTNGMKNSSIFRNNLNKLKNVDDIINQINEFFC